MPSRYAMRELKATYLSSVEQEVQKFLKEKVKYDYLNPGNELSLSLTVRDAEKLIKATPEH
jgi:hypothetical protein